jgi:glycine/serine hydroxymethyltransferase
MSYFLRISIECRNQGNALTPDQPIVAAQEIAFHKFDDPRFAKVLERVVTAAKSLCVVDRAPTPSPSPSSTD